MRSTVQTENRPGNSTRGQVQNQPQAAHFVSPEVNIFETKDRYVLEAEMPGVSKEGLEVTVDNGELTLVGRRSSYETKGTLLHRESRESDYRRVFELDPSIDAANISAKIENGVLRITLPKAEAVKPRKIAVS